MMRTSAPVLLALLASQTMASDNGLLWKCDTTVLADEGFCQFTRTNDEVDCAHSMDRAVGEDGFR